MTTLLLTDTAATLAYESLLSAGCIVLFSVLLYFTVKGKLRNWFMR